MKKIVLLFIPVCLILAVSAHPSVTKEQIAGVWQADAKENYLGSATYLDFQASGMVVTFVDGEWHKGSWWVNGDTLWFSRDFFDDYITFLLVKSLAEGKMNLCNAWEGALRCANLNKTKLTSAEIEAKWKEQENRDPEFAEEGEYVTAASVDIGYAGENCGYTMQSRDTFGLYKQPQETFYGMAATAGNDKLFCGHVEVNDTTRHPIVRQYLASGSIDAGFANNGAAILESLGEAQCISVIGNKILVGGGAYREAGWYDMAIWVLNANGKPDLSFNGNGFVTVDLRSGDDDVVTAITMQPDGKIVACGYMLLEYNVFVVRYNADGSPDKSFGKDGVQVFTDNYFEPHSISIQHDNKILIAGTAGAMDSYDFAVCRLHGDGSLDETFGGDGMLTASVSSQNDEAFEVKEMQDGRIAAFGYSWDESYTTYFTAVVWLPNGEADASFCSQGYLTTGMPEEEGWEGFEIKDYNEFIVHTFNNRDSVLEYSRRVYSKK